MVALFTDTDWRGGGTDATGFTIRARYRLSKNWNFGGSLFVNEIEAKIGNSTDYTRSQIDFEFTF